MHHDAAYRTEGDALNARSACRGGFCARLNALRRRGRFRGRRRFRRYRSFRRLRRLRRRRGLIQLSSAVPAGNRFDQQCHAANHQNQTKRRQQYIFPIGLFSYAVYFAYKAQAHTPFPFLFFPLYHRSPQGSIPRSSLSENALKGYNVAVFIKKHPSPRRKDVSDFIFPLAAIALRVIRS